MMIWFRDEGWILVETKKPGGFNTPDPLRETISYALTDSGSAAAGEC
jgi:hypothetical protein